MAASRLRPLLEDAMRSRPQFAFLQNRQTADALDRVQAHCAMVRQQVASARPDPFARGRRQAYKLRGGMMLSLDISKAFDCLPREYLHKALLRIGTPPDLIQLVLFLHHHMLLVFERDSYVREIRTGTGIRQGCGLAPLLWCAYTLLVFDTLEAYIPRQQLTLYADDMHIYWTISSALQYHNARRQIGRIIADLQSLGMHISFDKTAVLVHLGGSACATATRGCYRRLRTGKHIIVPTPTGSLLLPVKREHLYLGMKIGYHNSERSSVSYRIEQSWHSFNRIRRVLTSGSLPLPVRLRLWKACVRTVLFYGLSTLLLDEVCVHKLRSHCFRQLRILARSPAHVTHESNDQLLSRLQCTDVIDSLQQLTNKRVALARQHLNHVQTDLVHQRWAQLLEQKHESHTKADHPRSSLTAVTQVPRKPATCKHCGATYSSLHALRTHIGKSHPQESQAKTKSSYPDKSHRTPDLMKHAVDGQPQCVHCGKRFASWRSFAGHFVQTACPVYHDPEASATADVRQPSGFAEGVFAPEAAEGDVCTPQPSANQPTPLFEQTAVKTAAEQGQRSEIAALIRNDINKGYCPICRYKCTTSSYISRHACFQHPDIKSAESVVRQWAQHVEGPGQACRWCLQPYQQTAKAHRKACAVLWTVGHLLHKHSTLVATGQRAIENYGTQRVGGAQESLAGASAVRGALSGGAGGVDETPVTGLHSAGDQHPLEQAVRELRGDPMDTKDQAKRADLAEPSQAPDQEETPSKYQKAAGKGNQHSRPHGDKSLQVDAPQQQQQGRRRERERDWQPASQRGGQPWWEYRSPKSPQEMEEIRQLLRELARLVLRQADAISCLQMDVGYMIFLKTSMQPRLPEEPTATLDWAVVHNLYQVAQKWHQDKEKNPESVTTTLRTTLVYCLISTLLERVESAESKPQDMARLQALGLVEDNRFLYLRWNAERRCHDKATREHLPMEQAKIHLRTIMQHLVFPKVIMWFHALRKLSSTMTADIVPFTLEIHNRCQESQQVFMAFERLCHSSIWHLLGGTLRASKLGRGPLEKSIEDLARKI
ncbi:unnamed protein product [Symbiodinium sp. CCMP2592]|nr:unnamed protein product [Symbiodinium sp. CCMP2592]